MWDNILAGGVVAVFFVGIGALLSCLLKKVSVISVLVNSFLILFGSTFLNAILVFRKEGWWWLIFIPVFMPFSKILLASNDDSSTEWGIVGVFCIFVCFAVLLAFRDIIRIFGRYGIGVEFVMIFVFALELIYFYIILASFKKCKTIK